MISRSILYFVIGALLLAAPVPLGLAQEGDSHGNNSSTPAAQDHDVASDASHEADEPSVFSGGLGNAILTLVIFLTVAGILGKYVWPQLLRVLDEREQQIRVALEDAKTEREKAEKLLADYKRQIDQAREEATAIVEGGRRDAEVAHRRIQDEARHEANETIERARREIQLATDAAVKDLYDRTANLSVQIAGSIIRKELNAADHQGLVNESLQRMGREGSESRNEAKSHG